MIQLIRNLAKKSQKIVNTYSMLRYRKDIPLRDYKDIKKLKLFWKVALYTMVSYAGLSNVYELSKIVEKKKMNGCFVECGVWRGGSAAIMATIAHEAKSNRKIWLFDSFEGLPEPTSKDGDKAKLYAGDKISGDLSSINKCVGPLEDVEKLFFSLLHLDKKNVFLEKGYFQNTLPKCKNKIGPIAILRLDGDWYESTKVCLDNLYDNVIKGGYVIIDDYGCWEGCRKAVDEFFIKRRLNIKLNKVDISIYYFQKT